MVKDMQQCLGAPPGRWSGKPIPKIYLLQETDKNIEIVVIRFNRPKARFMKIGYWLVALLSGHLFIRKIGNNRK